MSQRGLTLLEVIIASALLVPITLVAYSVLDDSIHTTAHIGENFQLRSQGAASLERIAQVLELSRTTCPDFRADPTGIEFNLPSSVAGGASWGGSIEFTVQSDGVLRRINADGSLVALMANAISLEAEADDRFVTLILTIKAPELSGAGQSLKLFRRVVLAE